MKTERENWAAIARGAVERKPKFGKPKGKLECLVQMGDNWSKIPNTLLEDEAGQLWLSSQDVTLTREGKRTKGCVFEAVDVVAALTWIKNVSEFCDDYDGDIADVCRIALAELARRPTDLERVSRAMLEKRQAGFKPRRARKDKGT
jgi:hypothetical protein